MERRIINNKSELKLGDSHYLSYVGPPKEYDVMGATQFRLLCTLGLREHHKLLDFGCGSLRAGKFFINYLSRGCYFGIDPNHWLIEDAFDNEIGRDINKIKEPRFDYNHDFETAVFGEKFDFIVAQSIFSHTGKEMLLSALRNFKSSLKDDGLIVVTFREGLKDYDAEGWVYVGDEKYKFNASPKQERITYKPETILGFGNEVGLHIVRIPWYHRRQAWYILAKEEGRLPKKEWRRYLLGPVLYDSDYKKSLKW